MIKMRSLAVACWLAMYLSSEVSGQPTWSQRSPATSPTARDTHSMVYDPSRGTVVMFGGYNVTMVQQFADTWEWDGLRWSQISTPTVPPARETFAMASDGAAGILLFGGISFRSSPRLRQDTWRFANGSWALVNPTTSPSARRHTAMVCVGSTVLLFGGWDGYGQNFGDTWEWTGSDWVQRFPANSPSPRRGHGMAYDSSRGRVVLFGGGDGGTGFSDTWEWDGNNWTQMFPVTKPSPRSSPLVYDTDRGRTVLFGGSGLADTWEWDGQGWIERQPSSGPSGRGAHALAYHPPSMGTVLFGGRDTENKSLGDTWEYRLETAPASFTSFGVGCPGSAGVTALAPEPGSLPWVGESFELELTPLPSTPLSAPFGLLGASNTNWGPFTLPLDLGVIGAPGCSIYTSIELSVPLSNVGGQATWLIPVPNTVPLIGLSFFAQGLVIDLPANQAGIVVSNAGQAVIGVR